LVVVAMLVISSHQAQPLDDASMLSRTRQAAHFLLILQFTRQATHSLLILYVSNRFHECAEECVSMIVLLFSLTFLIRFSSPSQPSTPNLPTLLCLPCIAVALSQKRAAPLRPCFSTTYVHARAHTHTHTHTLPLKTNAKRCTPRLHLHPIASCERLALRGSTLLYLPSPQPPLPPSLSLSHAHTRQHAGIPASRKP
jgi:hypothetical protein